MAIERIYTEEQGTPLKYLKFLKGFLFFLLIVRFVMAIVTFSEDFTVYGAVFNLVGFVLIVTAIIGIYSMKWFGVLAFYGIYMLPIFDSIYVLTLTWLYDLHGFGAMAVGQIVGASLFLFPSIVYFGKRRLLFEPLPKDCRGVKPAPQIPPPYEMPFEPQSVIPQQPVVSAPATPPQPETGTQGRVLFCRKCGARLLEGSQFCSYCGASVWEES